MVVKNEGRGDERRRMVEGLKRQKILHSRRVEDAMLSVPRHLFVPPGLQHSAYADTPLPIGHGQTISAPHMVAIMLEAAVLEPGMNVLEIGAGSGYQAAVVASIVGPSGHVYTIERLPELTEGARNAIGLAGLENVTVLDGDGSLGLDEYAPYSRIFVTCGAPSLPKPLAKQLADGGIILIPEGGERFQVLCEYRKKNGRLLKQKRENVMFVPLVGEHGFKEG